MSALPVSSQSHRGLCCRRLAAARGGKRVLDDVSIDLFPGEVLGVLGANGAGKSTLLASLAGDLPIDPGLHSRCPVSFNGRDIVNMKTAELARVRAVLPQKPELIFDLVVEDVVSMGFYPFPELSPAACETVLDAALEHADATALRERRYLELSGGEQQRAQFARVLAQLLAAAEAGKHDCYLLLDEPSSSLDPAHQHGLLRAVRRMAAATGSGVLVVLHDVNLAALYCDRLAMMAQGAIVASGAPSEVLRPDLLRRVYNTEACVQAHPVHAHVPLVVFL